LKGDKKMKVHDLTSDLYEGMPMFPASFYPAPKMEFVLEPESDPAHRYVGKFEISNHTGTHLDAPLHYNYGKDKTIDQAPLDALVGECIVVDMYHKKLAEGITADDLTKATVGKDLKNKRLVIRTGYSDKYWGEADYFKNALYLTGDAAQWIVKQGVVLVGIDFLTDKPGDSSLPVHNELLQNGVYILEYMVNVKDLPPSCTLVVAPLKLRNMEASPCRVYALEL
jgi:arylformamidase